MTDDRCEGGSHYGCKCNGAEQADRIRCLTARVEALAALVLAQQAALRATVILVEPDLRLLPALVRAAETFAAYEAEWGDLAAALQAQPDAKDKP